MLYDLSTAERCVFESQKERNLYAKYLAGFFFNELVAGYRGRLQMLGSFIQDGIGRLGGDPRPLDLQPSQTHVSFDNYYYHLALAEDPGRNRGEFADVLIHDTQRRIAVPIEIKYLSTFSIKNYIMAITQRILAIREGGAKTMFAKETQWFPCLLLTQDKWNFSRQKDALLQAAADLRLEGLHASLVLWEDFLARELYSPETMVVRQYLGAMLSRRTPSQISIHSGGCSS